MLSLYATLTIKQKDAIERVMHQYVADRKFDMKYLGIAQYSLMNLITDIRAVDYDMYFDVNKVIDMKNKHHLNDVQVVDILLNKNLYFPIGKLRDNHNSNDITCIDDIIREERRWCKFFTDAVGKIVRIVYNIRVHRITRKSILGIITCFPIDASLIESNSQIYANYLRILSSDKNPHKNSMNKMILEWLNCDKFGGERLSMQYRNKITNEIVDLSEQEIYNLSLSDVLQLEPYMDTFGEASAAQISTIISYDDCKKMQVYYGEDDKVNDPNGLLHEEYISTFSFEPINEINLLQYSKNNAMIFNELLDMKYKEVGGQRKVDNVYTMNHWKEFGPAFRSVGYGYDQSIIYENLCAAFGKDKVDHVWCNYYEIP